MAILGNHEVNALRFHAIGSDVPIEAPDCVQYPSDAPVTFFGHYALKDASPGPITDNLACLDYGFGKGGFLCAYVGMVSKFVPVK